MWSRRRGHLHKRVWYRHRCNDHNVHKQRKDNDPLVEAKKPVVFLESVVDQVGLYNLEEVPVQSCVNEEVYDLLDPVPDVVDVYVSVPRLTTGSKAT